MARLGTANSLGMILGPAVSGALATLGLLAPLYFAGALSAAAAILVWRALPAIPAAQLGRHAAPRRLRFLDVRIRRFVLTAIALFTGFSAIQQTLGFQLQDQLRLTGVQTAQYTGAALMVSALFTFVVQVTVMQRLKLPPHVFVRTGLGACFLARCSWRSSRVLSCSPWAWRWWDGTGPVHARHHRRRLPRCQCRGTGRCRRRGVRLPRGWLRERPGDRRPALPPFSLTDRRCSLPQCSRERFSCSTLRRNASRLRRSPTVRRASLQVWRPGDYLRGLRTHG
jgi:hypothetical protein